MVHDFVKRYISRGKFKGINDASLLAWRHTPHFLREMLVEQYYRAFPNRLPPVRFLVFAQGRTGSTVLMDLLNSHRQISCLGEIFSRNVIRSVQRPVEFAEGLCCLSTNLASGYKVAVYQITNSQRMAPRDFLRRFRERGWSILYLKRTNLLRHAVSDIRGDYTRIFHHTSDKGDTSLKSTRSRRIHVPIDRLFETLKFREDCLTREANALDGFPHFMIEYERDLLSIESKQAVMDRIFEYLSLPACRVKTEYRKVTSRDLSDVLSNHEEIRDAVKGTRYEQYLGWG